MARKKQARIVVPGESDVSKKALSNSEVVYWGHEPKWIHNDFESLAREQWESIPSQLKQASWFELSEEERTKLINRCIEGKIHEALNWYWAMSDKTKLKKYFLTYIEAIYPNTIIKGTKVTYYDAISSLNENLFLICGKLARLHTLGCPLTESIQNSLDKFVLSLIEEYKASKVEKKSDTEKIVVPIKKPLDPFVSDVIGRIQSNLDDYGFGNKGNFPYTSFSDSVFALGATQKQWKEVFEYFQPFLNELKEVLVGKDELLNEGYSCYSKKSLANILKWFIAAPQLTPATEKVIVKQRKQRKKKVKSPKELTKLVTFSPEDAETGTKSVNKEDIVGASQLWIYDKDKRKLCLFNAKEKGFSVHRTALLNFDEKTSISKKVRKPKEVIPNVVTAGKVALRHLMDDIKAVASPMKSRLNSNMVLLKVVK